MEVILLIVVVVGLAGLIYTIHKASKKRSADQQEEWQRQDEIANKLIESNRDLNKKLNEIHTLVNSNLTSALELELLALRGQVELMKRLGEFTKATADDNTRLAKAEKRVSELMLQLGRTK